MTARMTLRSATLTCLLALATATAGGAALAQGQPPAPQGCQADQNGGKDACRTPQKGQQPPQGQKPQGQPPKGQPPKGQPEQHSGKKPEQQHAQNQPRRDDRGPHVGDSGKGGRSIQQARNSRLPAPPKNEHYRVIDDHVVRVNDKSQKIVAIVGLASELLN